MLPESLTGPTDFFHRENNPAKLELEHRHGSSISSLFGTLSGKGWVVARVGWILLPGSSRRFQDRGAIFRQYPDSDPFIRSSLIQLGPSVSQLKRIGPSIFNFRKIVLYLFIYIYIYIFMQSITVLNGL